MIDDKEKCTFIYSNVVTSTKPYTIMPFKLMRCRDSVLNFSRHAASQVPLISSLVKPSSGQGRAYPLVQGVSVTDEPLDLKPGDWVEVRSAEEIFSTLDEKGRYRGLYFMPEMKKHCGRRFKVFKNVRKIMLETTGEMRKIVSPTVFLEENFCEGDYNGKCDRSCFFYWREKWLKRSAPPQDAPDGG